MWQNYPEGGTLSPINQWWHSPWAFPASFSAPVTGATWVFIGQRILLYNKGRLQAGASALTSIS